MGVRKVFYLFAILLIPSYTYGASFHFQSPQCRLADSRKYNNPLLAHETRELQVRGEAVEAQGGDSGCSVPEDAVGITIGLTSIQPTSPSGSGVYGYMQVYKCGVSAPVPAQMSTESGEFRSSHFPVAIADPLSTCAIKFYSTLAGHYTLNLDGYWTE